MHVCMYNAMHKGRLLGLDDVDEINYNIIVSYRFA